MVINKIAKYISYNNDTFVNRLTPLIEDVSSEPVNFTSEPLNQILNPTISKPAPILQKNFPTLWDAKERADVNECLSMPLNDAANYPILQKSKKLAMEVAESALSDPLSRQAAEAPILQSNFETALIV